MALERLQGLLNDAVYAAFQARAKAVKNGLLSFLVQASAQGKTVAGSGAAAKGNTILNFAGIRLDPLPFVCDATPSKQGSFLSGRKFPILPPQALFDHRPD
jgi:hypothetical protein